LGGKIEAFSDKGQGTTFLVHLPAVSDSMLAAAGNNLARIPKG
jgi:chemotaxis protein histidine kinase CheA